jgi:hypothetical protein
VIDIGEAFVWLASDYSALPTTRPDQLSPAMNLKAVTLGKKQYATACVVTKLEKPVIFRGGAPPGCGISKMLSAESFVPTITSFDFGFKRTAPTNSASFTHCFSTNSYGFSMLALM